MKPPAPRTISRVLACAALAGLLAACSPASREVEVTGAEFRPPLGSSTVGVAYLSIISPVADRITAVSSPMARAVEMHASVDDGGTMRMQRLESLELPAGEPVVFAPGGLHFMVFDPAPLDPGAAFPITIVLESGRNLEAGLSVFTPGGGSAGHGG
jgi:copper(I)-binding protein